MFLLDTSLQTLRVEIFWMTTLGGWRWGGASVTVCWTGPAPVKTSACTSGQFSLEYMYAMEIMLWIQSQSSFWPRKEFSLLFFWVSCFKNCEVSLDICSGCWNVTKSSRRQNPCCSWIVWELQSANFLPCRVRDDLAAKEKVVCPDFPEVDRRSNCSCPGCCLKPEQHYPMNTMGRAQVRTMNPYRARTQWLLENHSTRTCLLGSCHHGSYPRTAELFPWNPVSNVPRIGFLPSTNFDIDEFWHSVSAQLSRNLGHHLGWP